MMQECRWFGNLNSLDGSNASLLNSYQLLAFDTDLKILKRYQRIYRPLFHEYFTTNESLNHLGICIYRIENRPDDYNFVDFAVSSELKMFNTDFKDSLTVVTPIKLILIKDLIEDIGDTFLELLKNDIPFLKTLLITYLNENV